MADIAFMQQKFSVKQLLQRYAEEVKALKPYVSSPIEETKLQYYYQAVATIQRTTVVDKVQFALSFGRSTKGKVPQIRDAFPTLLATNVGQPTKLDLAYSSLLLEYASAFDTYKGNLKEWSLRFILTSRFSPIREFVQREIEGLILHTQERINQYQSMF